MTQAKLSAMLVSTLLSALAILLSSCGGNADMAMNSPKAQAAPPTSAIRTFPAPRNNYTITRTATGFDVKDDVGAGGTVSLVDLSSVHFTDVAVNLLIGDNSKTISASNLKTLIELYIAFFNRVPDAEGMNYWIDRMKEGVTVTQLSNNFYSAAIIFSSVTGYSETMSNEAFVRVIYKNVLGRNEVDAEGLEYWTTALASGKETRGSLINTILNSAHTFKGNAEFGFVADLLDNKVAVGTYFAIQQGLNYNTPEESITNGMIIAAAVTPTDITAAKNLINMKDTLFDLRAVVSNAEFDVVQKIVNARCIECHGATRAESRISLHTADLIRLNASPLFLATVVTRSMPQNGTLSASEINAITVWFNNGAH